jgi:hypothetical protein
MKKGRVKKVKPTPITAEDFLNGSDFPAYTSDITSDDVLNVMIAFAKQKVTEALHETSEHFKNADNVSYIKNHYSLDKIV